jgi:hypothetical protein
VLGAWRNEPGVDFFSRHIRDFRLWAWSRKKAKLILYTIIQRNTNCEVCFSMRIACYRTQYLKTLCVQDIWTTGIYEKFNLVVLNSMFASQISTKTRTTEKGSFRLLDKANYKETLIFRLKKICERHF